MLHIKAGSARLCPAASLFFAEVGQAYARVKTCKEMLFIILLDLYCVPRRVRGIFSFFFSRLIERGRIIKYLYHEKMLDKRGVVNVKQGGCIRYTQTKKCL